jgi:hypothetical protein
MSITLKQREAFIEQSDSVEVYLFTFGVTTYYFTSYFQNIIIDDQEYLAIPITRGSIPYSSDLSDITASIEVAMNTTLGSLFMGNVPIQDCQLEIRKYFLADLTIYDVVISGFIKAPVISEGKLKFSCSSWFNIINNDFPRLRFQARCNNQLFDAFCALVTNNWRLSATVLWTDGLNVLFSFASVPSSYTTIYRNFVNNTLQLVNAPIANFFTFGKIAKQSDSSNLMFIIAHSIISASTGLLELQFPLENLLAGDLLYIWPGCSKTYDSNSFDCVNFCKSFRSGTPDESDTINHFLGMPAIPYKNPTLTPVSGT